MTRGMATAQHNVFECFFEHCYELWWSMVTIHVCMRYFLTLQWILATNIPKQHANRACHGNKQCSCMYRMHFDLINKGQTDPPLLFNTWHHSLWSSTYIHLKKGSAYRAHEQTAMVLMCICRSDWYFVRSVLLCFLPTPSQHLDSVHNLSFPNPLANDASSGNTNTHLSWPMYAFIFFRILQMCISCIYSKILATLISSQHAQSWLTLDASHV